MIPPDQSKNPFREPVLTWGVLPSGLTVLFTAAQILGWLPALGEDQLVTLVNAVLFLIMIAGWVITRRKVTPNNSPRDGDGTALVRTDGRKLLADRDPHRTGDF